MEMPTIVQKRGTSPWIRRRRPLPPPPTIFLSRAPWRASILPWSNIHTHIELENAVSPPIDCRDDRLIERESITAPGIAIGIFPPQVRASKYWLLPIRLGTNAAMSAMGCVHETGSLAGQASMGLCALPPNAQEFFKCRSSWKQLLALYTWGSKLVHQHASHRDASRRCGSVVHRTSYKQARRKRHACEGECGLGASPSDLGRVERKKRGRQVPAACKSSA